MKILIITAWYYPFIHPRAHRWTALAEYWAEQGHDVQVVTARRRGYASASAQQGVQVHRAGFDSLKEVFYYYFKVKKARGRLAMASAKPSCGGRLAVALYHMLWKNLVFPDDAAIWYVPARKKIKQLLKSGPFDAVISVSLPFTSHLLGQWAQHLCRAHPVQCPIWIADIGDPYFVQPKSLIFNILFQKTSRSWEQKILTHADFVAVTTAATREKYKEIWGDRAIQNMSVIPPLWHPATLFPGHQGDHATLRLGYFGALYAPFRTPDALIAVIKQALDLRPDLRDRLEWHFYGEIFPEFFDVLRMIPHVHLHGLCPRETVQKAMVEMDVLLNIGNQTDFQLPSKAVDYRAANRPILNLQYADKDPFADFFGDSTLIFNLKVKKEGGGEVAEIRRWIEWLEQPKTALSEEEWEQVLRPHSVERVAAQYEWAIRPPR